VVKKTESTELTIFGPGEISSESPLDLKALRREALISEGLLKPRKKYKSAAEKKEARTARSKERRAERKELLREKGLYTPQAAKMSKEQKKVRSKAKRRAFNQFLAGNPNVARELGIDPNRRRVL